MNFSISGYASLLCEMNVFYALHVPLENHVQSFSTCVLTSPESILSPPHPEQKKEAELGSFIHVPEPGTGYSLFITFYFNEATSFRGKNFRHWFIALLLVTEYYWAMSSCFWSSVRKGAEIEVQGKGTCLVFNIPRFSTQEPIWSSKSPNHDLWL